MPPTPASAGYTRDHVFRAATVHPRTNPAPTHRRLNAKMQAPSPLAVALDRPTTDQSHLNRYFLGPEHGQSRIEPAGAKRDITQDG